MNFGIRNDDILNYKSVCYIAKRNGEVEDDFGNILPTYEKPQKYWLNIQPITNSNSSEYTAFGELIPRMKVAIIPSKTYLGMFSEFDLAYLDGIEPVDESFNGEKANYRIYSIQPQNAIIKVYFLKIIKGE